MQTRSQRTSDRPRRARTRQGVATVELALTLPLLFLLLFSALEIGRMSMIKETVNNAAYEAARTCIVPGASNADGVTAANQILSSIGVSDATVVVQPDTITHTTPTVTATVSVPFSSNMWLAPFYATSGSAEVTCTLTRDWVLSTNTSL